MTQPDRPPDHRKPPPQSRALRREITGLLLIKLALLTVIYFTFFGPSSRPNLATPDLAAHIMADTTSAH